MRHYSYLKELLEDLNRGDFDSIDISDRDRLIYQPIKDEMTREMLSPESTYRLHKLARFPIIGKMLMSRRINQYINWVDGVFTNEYCQKIRADMTEELKLHGSELNEAFELLDEESKRLFLDLICLRLTGDFRYALSSHWMKEQYLSEKITWKEKPNIVDAGGYIGDTLLSFLRNGIIPGEYYIYELEENNYTQLLKNVETASKKGVKVYIRKKGVYSKNGKLYFIADRDSSKIVDYQTDNSIDVVTIDSDVKARPDFIKMDIEGSEVEALEGAADLIRQYSPTLAICIYHKKDDFWKIPLLIHSINPNYKRFWIDHYQISYNETVLYVSM